MELSYQDFSTIDSMVFVILIQTRQYRAAIKNTVDCLWDNGCFRVAKTNILTLLFTKLPIAYLSNEYKEYKERQYSM